MRAESMITVSADPLVELFVAQYGDRASPVLLVIHGGPDWDHTYLRDPLAGLARCRVVFADVRGCGRSTRGLGDTRYTPAAVAADLLAVLDAVGVARADVLGFSWGGLIAQRLALTAPGRIRRLVIASSTILPVPPEAFAGWAERDRRRAAEAAVWSDPALSGPQRTRAAAIAAAPANVWQPAALGEYLARLERIRFSADWLAPWQAGILPPARPPDAAARLAATGLPILLLHGRQDMTFPAALASRAAGLIPAARAVVLDQASHMTHIDQPRAWLAAITSFLT